MTHLLLILPEPLKWFWHVTIEWMYWPESERAYGFFSSVGGTPLFALGALSTILAVYKQHNCKAHWWCPMWGHHQVAGTTAVVCHVHHTEAHHRRLQARHKRKYSHRLGHGESPDPVDG